MPSPAIRRILVAIVAAVGLVLLLVGGWLAVLVGPQGTATFSARSSDPVVITPDTLNRVAAPVTVTATSTSGPVFVAAALPQDATDAMGKGKHAEVVVAQFPSGSLELTTTGSGAVPDPTSYHVWRTSGQGSLTITQDQGAQSVVVFPTKGGEVDVTVSVSRRAWFLQALALLVIGLVVLGFAGYWLYADWKRGRGPAPASGEEEENGEPFGESPDEPLGQRAEEPSGDEAEKPSTDRAGEPTKEVRP